MGDQDITTEEREAKVQRETVLDAPSNEVWEALTDERMLGEWLADEAELDPVPGGRASFRFADGEERDGIVLEVEEERLLTFSWARDGELGSVVELTLEPAVGGTRLVVVERGPVAATARAASGWAPRLQALSSALSLVAV